MGYVEMVYLWLTNVESSFSFWFIGAVLLAIIVYRFLDKKYNDALNLVPPFMQDYLDELLVFVEGLMRNRMVFIVQTALAKLPFSDQLERWLVENQKLTIVDLSNLLTETIVKHLYDAFEDFGMDVKDYEEKIGK